MRLVSAFPLFNRDGDFRGGRKGKVDDMYEGFFVVAIRWRSQFPVVLQMDLIGKGKSIFYYKRFF